MLRTLGFCNLFRSHDVICITCESSEIRVFEHVRMIGEWEAALGDCWDRS